MDQSTNKIRAILSEAIKLEKNGLLKYLRFARNTNDITGKNMFIQLALDEYEHQDILEKQYMNNLNNDDWQMIEIPETTLEKLAPKITPKQERIRGSSGVAEIEALHIALDFEKKAMNYYLENASILDNEAGKEYLLRLADWEKAHYNIIQAELDYINQTGFWFDIPEFRMDGKF
ncbi:ferritin family protein [candidate division KSB1 bacterium]|nr:ferritin family protein [candidate division KSB1 bacterium]